MKGIFRLRPSLPRYTCTYDATVVLRYLRNMAPPQEISLKDMSLKLAMLLCLLTGHRDQVLPSLDVTSMHLKEGECVFFIKDMMKTTRPGHHIAPTELKCYPEDESICPVKQISHYLWMTRHIRAVYVKLFISYSAPHKPVTTSTLSRWCREVLQRSGISKEFTSHSTRSLATSKAFQQGRSLSEINKAAGWTSSSVFAKYYNKPIKETIGEYILNSISGSDAH